MHNSKAFAIFVVLALSVIGLSSSAHQAQAQSAETPAKVLPPKPWEHILELLTTMEKASAWSAKSPRTASEWKGLIQCAAELQEFPPADAHAAFVLYMVRQCGPDNANAKGFNASLIASTKPMLVLRLMFDIPPTAQENMKDFPLGDPHWPTVCAGIPFEACGTAAMPAASYSVPVLWEDGEPKLSACPNFHFGGSFGFYQPHIEYEYFKLHFAYRKGLRDWLAKN